MLLTRTDKRILPDFDGKSPFDGVFLSIESQGCGYSARKRCAGKGARYIFEKIHGENQARNEIARHDGFCNSTAEKMPLDPDSMI